MMNGSGPGRPARGFMIPEALKDRLDRFETNGDGRLSAEEVNAMRDRPSLAGMADRSKNIGRRRP
jgi:hypothetical protein